MKVLVRKKLNKILPKKKPLIIILENRVVFILRLTQIDLKTPL